MAKKKAQKQQKRPESKQETHPKQEEKTFDHGGLPARDLKKNLGCG